MNKKYKDMHTGKDARTEDESQRLRVRTTLLMAFFSCVLLAFFFVLYQTQIVHGQDYLADASTNAAQSETVDSVRGEILDRYGRVLVSNTISYHVELDTALMGEDRNQILTRLIALCREEGITWSDSFPVSQTAPWTYTKDDVFSYTSQGEDGTTSTLLTRLGKLAKSYKWMDDPAASWLDPEALMTAMCETYDLETEPDGSISQETRDLLGVLYELSLRSKQILYDSYVFAQDVGISFISKVKEQSLTGVTIETASTRKYNTTYASHVLGVVGDISSDEWPTYQELGYPMNASVGKYGVEKAFEEYLHGTSGTRLIETDENGKIISQQWKTEPQPGGNVVLTIDSALQGVTEDLLAQYVQGLDDPQGAAAVMMDMTGGVLAMASYPTYDLSSYFQNYNELLADPATPLLNRATMGLYAPGSTFKMVTAVAGLSEGIISPSSTVICTGRYTYYPDVQPVCWIYTNTGGNHGSETVSEAITDSCNIFFYDLGRRVGITKLVEYATKFGLGQYTGIELPEYKGTMAGPEYTESQGGIWYDGSTMYAAIGQESNQFTPIQLANYVATLVNGGNHYQAHLLKEVKSSDYSQLVYQYEPVLMDTIQIDPVDLAAVKKGMYDLSQTASMARYFADLPVTVGCKTGTAEVPGHEATSVFVCFAPYDDPQVALCLVGERGASGGNLASLAAEMLRQYFSTDSSLSAPAGENTLLH